jgi:hypothetical protein
MTQVVYLIPGQGAVVHISLPGISAPVFSGVEDVDTILRADRRNCVFSAHPLPSPGHNILLCKLAGKKNSSHQNMTNQILDDVLKGAVTKVTAKTWTVLRSMLACGADPSSISVFLKKDQALFSSIFQ